MDKKRSLLKPDSTKSNFAFQLFYQTVILVIPLIVSPYLTRTLGSASLGIYTYTYSIAYYFVVVAMLGVNRHGQRIIAQRRGDVTKLRVTFWSLYAVHAVISVLALTGYIAYVAFLCGSDRDIAFVQTIYVFSAALDITWVFYGLEKFKHVSLRNAAVKLLETACIFLFVRDPSDLGRYTLIMSVSICLGQGIMLPQVIAAIPPIRFSWKDMREHFKPMLTLFAAVVAITLYTAFDKTLLGLLSTKDNVAFYEYSDKIVRIPRTFVSIIGTVMFPRACRCAEEKDRKGMDGIFANCLLITCFIGFGACFGTFAVGKLFAVVYYGRAFAVCGSVMRCMCPLILIMGLGESIRQSYIYPMKMDTAMVKILSVNAAVNLVLSAVLIPKMGIYGAVLGTICAESVGLAGELWLIRRYLQAKSLAKQIVPFAVTGLVMYACVRAAALFYDGTVPALILQILVGIAVYCGISFVYGYFFNKKVKAMIMDTWGILKRKLHPAS